MALETFDPFASAPAWPLTQLPTVKNEACSFLRAYSLEDLRSYAGDLLEAIEQRKVLELERATDACVSRLLIEGGAELQYYSNDQPLNEFGIRKLLADWPEEAEIDCPIPAAEDLSDLEILNALLESTFFENPRHKSGGRDEEVRNADELWALLALVKIEEALSWLGRAHGSPTTFVQLSIAADLTLEVALAVAEAKTRREWARRELRVSLREADLKEGPSKQMPQQAPPTAGRRSPPSASGTAARARQYAAMEERVQQETRRARESTTFDREEFLARLLVGLEMGAEGDCLADDQQPRLRTIGRGVLYEVGQAHGPHPLTGAGALLHHRSGRVCGQAMRDEHACYRADARHAHVEHPRLA